MVASCNSKAPSYFSKTFSGQVLMWNKKKQVYCSFIFSHQQRERESEREKKKERENIYLSRDKAKSGSQPLDIKGEHLGHVTCFRFAIEGVRTKAESKQGLSSMDQHSLPRYMPTRPLSNSQQTPHMDGTPHIQSGPPLIDSTLHTDPSE